MGVAVSPDGERIYVTEMGGQREAKIFDRDGDLLSVFSPPDTEPAERAPVYVAVGPTGRVFITDRLQRAVFVYDPDGELLDAILGPDLTLSEYAFNHAPSLQPGSTVAYNLFTGTVWVQSPDGGEQVLPAPDPVAWAPLGVRVDEHGTMLLTDVAEGQHKVREFPFDLMLAGSWHEFDPPEFTYGTQGQEDGELMFPNSAVADSIARLYVSDGNNGRISVWDVMGDYLYSFGLGVGESSLSLPRGIAIDDRDRLHVVDAVEQCVKVYDVSDLEPTFLYAFGDWGTEDGQFNYPGDITLDSTGRVYVADRENDRIQVWSY
jgi:DNA-binding beta-propeller fold protein YncE